MKDDGGEEEITFEGRPWSQTRKSAVRQTSDGDSAKTLIQLRTDVAREVL